MGWVLLAVIGAGAFVVLRIAGMPRIIGWFAAAALMLGATGYALQQRATLPGHRVQANAEAIEIDPGLVAFRTAIMPGAPGDAQILAAAGCGFAPGAIRARQWSACCRRSGARRAMRRYGPGWAVR